MQTERSPKGSSEGVDAEGQICCHCWIVASSGLNSRLQQWRNKNFQRPGTEAPRFFEGGARTGLEYTCKMLCSGITHA